VVRDVLTTPKYISRDLHDHRVRHQFSVVLMSNPYSSVVTTLRIPGPFAHSEFVSEPKMNGLEETGGPSGHRSHSKE
jgi:hypothetical protein